MSEEQNDYIIYHPMSWDKYNEVQEMTNEEAEQFFKEKQKYFDDQLGRKVDFKAIFDARRKSLQVEREKQRQLEKERDEKVEKEHKLIIEKYPVLKGHYEKCIALKEIPKFHYVEEMAAKLTRIENANLEADILIEDRLYRYFTTYYRECCVYLWHGFNKELPLNEIKKNFKKSEQSYRMIFKDSDCKKEIDVICNKIKRKYNINQEYTKRKIDFCIDFMKESFKNNEFKKFFDYPLGNVESLKPRRSRLHFQNAARFVLIKALEEKFILDVEKLFFRGTRLNLQENTKLIDD